MGNIIYVVTGVVILILIGIGIYLTVESMRPKDMAVHATSITYWWMPPTPWNPWPHGWRPWRPNPPPSPPPYPPRQRPLGPGGEQHLLGPDGEKRLFGGSAPEPFTVVM